MVKAKKPKDSTTKDVVFTGSLSLRVASDIRNQLIQALEDADTVNVLLKDTEDIDLSVVQIFCAAHRSAMLKNKTLILQNKLPDAFVQTINDAGLNGHIGCSAVEREGCVWQRI